MRRALLLFFVAVLCALSAPTARAATTVTINISSGSPSPNPANIAPGDKVKWHTDDSVSYTIYAEGANIATVPANGDSSSTSPFSAGTYDYTVKDAAGVTSLGSGQIVAEEAATTTTTTDEPTSTTKASTTTSSSTTTSTSSTTTTSSSTTTTTTLISSASGLLPIQDKGGKSGGSSALPLLLGAFVVVAALAGLAYWLWWRSGEPYDEDDGPDWTQEPPPTVQGPRI